MKRLLRISLVGWFLATRSVTRGNFGLSIVTISMIAIVYINLVFTPSLLEGVTNLTNSKLIHVLVGDISFEPKNGGDNLITDANNLLDKITGTDGVEAASAASRVPAEISKDKEFGSWDVVAINPNDDKRVFDTSKYLIEGDYLHESDRNEIVLGIQVAGADQAQLELYGDSLKNVHAGDTVTVKYPNKIEKQYHVKGIFKSEFVQSDNRVFITKDEFNNIYPNRNNTANIVYLKLFKNANQDQIIQKIATENENLQPHTWQEKAGFIKSATDSFDLINKILRTISLFVAGITVFIVTYVDVVNKRRQIGIQRAIGISSMTILLAYALRAIFYMVLGSALGVLAFLYIVVPLEAKYPFHFPQGSVLLAINHVFMIKMVGLLLAVGLISALIPAYRSIRIKIIDAIWSN